MYYYLSIGTNIDPEKSSVRILEMLCEAFTTLALFPFRYTEPEGVELSDTFLNALVVVYSPEDWVRVKAILNEIEAKMGRDRSDPLRSIKNRAADLDILEASSKLDFEPYSSAKEAYIKACFELTGTQVNLLAYGLASHQGPATIYIDALTGNIVVVDDELDRFKHWVESSFERQ